MNDGDFDSVTWENVPSKPTDTPTSNLPAALQTPPATSDQPPSIERRKSHNPTSPSLQANKSPSMAARTQDPIDNAGLGLNGGTLECEVSSPLKEGNGNDSYISYKITTNTDFKSFQKQTSSVRRRFTDFVFLQKALGRDYQACAVPPLPEKHKLEYVRGDRFGSDFTTRRAHSLQRFLKRLTLHPVLRRAAILVSFLESPDWNAHMKARGNRSLSVNESSGGVFDNFAETFVNAFTKVHKPDRRFIDVKEGADKLDDDLSHLEKLIGRVVRRQGDLEGDYNDLATQIQKLQVLEPSVEMELHAFALTIGNTAKGMSGLKDYTDQSYATSLRDMSSYIASVKSLLKTREQKQLDFEGLTDYLGKAVQDRDALASQSPSFPGGSAASVLSSPTGFIRSKVEDFRGVDHEQSRLARVRKLELQIEKLTAEVEDARRTSEMFDEEVVKEVADFERIKACEFKDTLGGLTGGSVSFYEGVVRDWEAFLKDLEEEGPDAASKAADSAKPVEA